MRTEYKVITYHCEQRAQIARALAQWTGEGWERVDSWRFTAIGVESVAFLLEREHLSRPEPKREICVVCEGTGVREIPRFEEGPEA